MKRQPRVVELDLTERGRERARVGEVGEKLPRGRARGGQHQIVDRPAESAGALDPDELTGTVYAVAGSSDEIDDIVREKFGGYRWVDPLPESSAPPPPPPPAPPSGAA